jgi:hypothetical protein
MGILSLRQVQGNLNETISTMTVSMESRSSQDLRRLHAQISDAGSEVTLQKAEKGLSALRSSGIGERTLTAVTELLQNKRQQLHALKDLSACRKSIAAALETINKLAMEIVDSEE